MQLHIVHITWHIDVMFLDLDVDELDILLGDGLYLPLF